MIPRITDLDSAPIPGRYYLVPCIRGGLIRRQWRDGGWREIGLRDPHSVPVLGPLHRDPELGEFPGRPHYHIDLRFVGRELWRRMELPLVRPEFAMGRIYTATQVIEPPTLRRMRCVRAEMEFPVGSGRIGGVLEPAYAGKRLDLSCMRCPHRGFDLRQSPPTDRGTVVCPGHGLEFCLSTGRLVPRSR